MLLKRKKRQIPPCSNDPFDDWRSENPLPDRMGYKYLLGQGRQVLTQMRSEGAAKAFGAGKEIVELCKQKGLSFCLTKAVIAAAKVFMEEQRIDGKGWLVPDEPAFLQTNTMRATAAPKWMITYGRTPRCANIQTKSELGLLSDSEMEKICPIAYAAIEIIEKKSLPYWQAEKSLELAADFLEEEVIGAAEQTLSSGRIHDHGLTDAMLAKGL